MAQDGHSEETRDRLRFRPAARRTLAGSRDLIRLIYRDPEHVAERITLYATRMLGESSAQWAHEIRVERPEDPEISIAEDLRRKSTSVARIDGAIAGTPFFVALVPGYVGYLWQEARMTLRLAALYGRDPTQLRTAAELLALRGVHPSADAAERALLEIGDKPLPEKPPRRRPVRLWVQSIYTLLVFGSFLPPRSQTKRTGWREWVKTIFGILAAGALWAITWIFPVTFMIAMAWGCESNTRRLWRRTVALYSGEAPAEQGARATVAALRTRERPRAREALRALLLTLSVAVPIGFIAYVDHVRNTTGVNWLGAVGALVALSLVIATMVVASRR
jgi:hypothetical protein